jgi:hypothetical protein
VWASGGPLNENLTIENLAGELGRFSSIDDDKVPNSSAAVSFGTL